MLVKSYNFGLVVTPVFFPHVGLVVTFRPFGPKSRSEVLCLCGTSISGCMAADGGDCVVQVVSAFSDENLCVLDLPSSSTVLDIKRHVQASHGISIFRQRLLVSPAGHQVEDHEVLAALPGLRLQLIRLEYADDDADGLWCLHRATGEGRAPEVERLLRLPLRPDCSQAEDGATALIAASEGGHLEVARLLSARLAPTRTRRSTIVRP